MGVDPAFAATVRHEAVSVSATADTSLTAPTTTVTLLTAGASGTKIEELLFQGIGSTLAGVVRVFIYDGSTYHLQWEEAVTVATSSNTAATYRQSRTFDNLVLKSSESLRITSAVASQLIKVHAFGGDL